VTKGDENELLRSVALQNATSILIARQRAERRSEAYLAEAQRLSRTGSFGWRPSTGETIWSDETFRIFQYDRTTKPTMELVLQRIHPEDVAFVKQTIERASQDGRNFDHEYRLVMPDSSVKYVHVVAHALSDESDGIEFIGAVTDITERKRADEERERLLASERAAFAEAMAAQQRFHDLVNSVEGIVWEADVPSFQFLFISKQAERVLGYPVERWLSEPTFWKDHVHPDDREWALQFCQTATAEKRDHQFEYRMIAADGSVVWLRDLVTVVVEGDRATRVRGLMVDLTNRKQAEEALRQAQADLAHVSRVTTMGELTASLAHEVKQPIAAASTNANYLLALVGGRHPKH
jgi:PAS domain S-box-containing protein